MTDFRQRIETTYADLRPTDLVIDKTGKAWPIVELDFGMDFDEGLNQVEACEFWLLDPVTKAKMHLMHKRGADPVTVSRVQTQTDEATKLEAEFPTPPGVAASMEEAVAAVEEIGGTVEAEVTAEEADAAHAATDDAPVQLPTFESMTPLEQRSHLYLLHGVYAADLKSRDELAAMHHEAHAGHEAGKLNSHYIQHVHEVK